MTTSVKELKKFKFSYLSSADNVSNALLDARDTNLKKKIVLKKISSLKKIPICCDRNFQVWPTMHSYKRKMI